MTTKDFIYKLKLYTFLLELINENQFKINTFRNATDFLVNSNVDIFSVYENNKVNELPGFGSSLTKIVDEYVKTGSYSQLNELSITYPQSLYELKKVKGLGPKRIKMLFERLNITNLNELEEAFNNNKINGIKGINDKQKEMIYNSLTHVQAGINKILQDECIDLSKKLISILKNHPHITNVELTGEARRFSEIISKIDILIESDFDKINYSQEAKNIISEIIATGVKLNIETVNKNNFYFRLNQLTGAEEYNNYFKEKFDEKLIKDKSFENEEALFNALSIQFIPPELRENELSINFAIEHNIPELVKDSDIKGMLHIHTDWSDGKNSYEEMVQKCSEMGFEYLAICDHSKSSSYVNGLSEERIFEQFELIAQIETTRPNIKILKGIECDILANGELDYSDDILSQFDIVVASIHSNFNLPKPEMTNRIIKATENQYITIIGHPTGRILKTRAGYEIDIDKFIDACASNNKVIEINANPYRLDFSYINSNKAKNKGVKLAINPDSHKTSTLKDVFIGAKVARKAWLTKDDIINCLDYKDFVQQYSNNK